MRIFTLVLAALILLAPFRASALTVAEYIAVNNDMKNGFLIGAVDMAILTSPPENNACILKWFTTDPTVSAQEFADAVLAAPRQYNVAGVLIDVIRNHCGIGGTAYPRR